MQLKNTFLTLFFVLTVSFQLSSQNSSVSTINDSTIAVKQSGLIYNVTDSIINYGKLFLNTPYRYGSSGSSSFDCSGFTSYVFRNFGVNLPRTSASQAEKLPTVDIVDIKNGDLVFFNGRRRNTKVGHVGIVVSTRENGEFDFIHASTQQGVVITNSNSDYYKRRFVKAGRVFINDSLLCFNVNPIHNNSSNFSVTQISDNSTIKKPAKYHYVKRGETLSSIAKKYNLTISELKQNNNLKRDFLKLKQKLLIENEVFVAVSRSMVNQNNLSYTDTFKLKNEAEKTISEVLPAFHEVKKGESLFSISKLYNIDEKKLKVLNNLTSNKIKVKQLLVLIENNKQNEITNATSTPTTEEIKQHQELTKPLNVNALTHKVSKGESLFSIAKLYKMSIDEIKTLNNFASDKLQVGQELTVSTTNVGTDAKPLKVNKTSAKSHKVQSGETLSSIAAKYGCKINEIKKWNDKTNNKLNIGEKLIIKVLKT